MSRLPSVTNDSEYLRFGFRRPIGSSLVPCLLLAMAVCFGPAVGSKALGVQEQNPSAPTFSDQQLEFFENKVRPILVEHCYECHGPEAKPIEGGLALSSRKAMLVGGDTGPAIVPGNADESLLVESIKYDGVYEMPPDTKLDDEKIKILTQWVNDGAAWPKSEDDASIVKKEFDIAGRKAEHWAWQPVLKKDIPPIKSKEWTANPIDHAVAYRLEQAGLIPAAPADRRTLIRRASFDLTGLPPTPEQVEAFLNDESENAFEKIVDELLASPRFGEHWARHWMDLVRYAETYGHEFDYPIPHAHEYRDYLIRAFNQDVSYKQLIEEHIAGDLLPKPRRNPNLEFNESKLGTGFWFFGEAKHGAVDSRGEQAATIDNQIDVMSKTFLGMTVACARCHDHKFDAISTADYYALSGFLISSRRERMMLDPQRKIETSLLRSKEAVSQADRLAVNLTTQLQGVDKLALKRYLDAIIELAPATEVASSGIEIEGEKLTQVGVGDGIVETQTIPKRDRFFWQGDQQFWWRDGKVGQEWTLTFPLGDKRQQGENAGAEKKKYKISARLTKANDYGAAAIFINGQVAKKKVDFYASELSCESIELGEFELKPGLQEIKFKLLKPNKAAIQRNMIGIDVISLVESNPQKELEEELGPSVAEYAKANQLDGEILTKLIALAYDDKSLSPSHPLYQVRTVLDARRQHQQWNDQDDRSFKQSIAKEAEQSESFQSASTLFADFNGPLPKHWSMTGFAFDGPADPNKFAQASTADSMLQPTGTISSGRFGLPFQGVLRSPSFTIENEAIHYRVRGSGVTVRLIIDGFFMDEYNALLYKDCKKEFPASEEFIWVTQAGDLANHIGSRAHIEILDYGNGFVEIDEIRFSKRARPPGKMPFLKSVVSSGEDMLATADRFETLLQEPDELPAEDKMVAADLTNWLVKNGLVAMLFSSDKEADVSVHDVGQVRFSSHEIRSKATNAAFAAGELIASHANRTANVKDVPAPMMALGMADGHGEEEHIFVRGNHKNLGPIVERRFLSALSKSPINPEDSSGRLQLARKITAPNNPLTTRVAVNRIWYHLMGRGIVDSVDNFGVLGKAPSHPILLDNLAIEFSGDAWSIKRLVRRIMLSKTYQMSSDLNPDAAEKDPDNLLLHRANIKRLSGESIRDTMLMISGRLDSQMFGPSVPIHLTPFMSGRGRPGQSGPLDGAGRRSVYLEIRRNFLSPMMLAFDTPIPFNAIGKRNQSNVPSQALILMNSPFVQSQAELWAKRLLESETSIEQKIDSAYQSAFGRQPNEMEVAAARDFLISQGNELNLNEAAINSNVEIWKDFCHVLFNVKEFIFIQ